MAADTSREQRARDPDALPYQWTQTLAAVDVNVPVARGTRARDVGCDIRREHLSVRVHDMLIAEVRPPLTRVHSHAQSVLMSAHGRSTLMMGC